MFKWYYDKTQPYFEEYNLEWHYIDTDCFICSSRPGESLIGDVKQLKEDFDFTDLDPSHELPSKHG